MDCDHRCEISQYELDNAVSEARRDAETRVDNLRYELERRIELLEGEIRRLQGQGRNY